MRSDVSAYQQHGSLCTSDVAFSDVIVAASGEGDWNGATQSVVQTIPAELSHWTADYLAFAKQAHQIESKASDNPPQQSDHAAQLHVTTISPWQCAILRSARIDTMQLRNLQENLRGAQDGLGETFLV